MLFKRFLTVVISGIVSLLITILLSQLEIFKLDTLIIVMFVVFYGTLIDISIQFDEYEKRLK